MCSPEVFLAYRMQQQPMPRLCRCGRIVDDVCTCGRGSSTQRRSTTQSGYSHDHRVASERYRANHPLCERCVQLHGVVGAQPAQDMHHIIGISVAPQRRMDASNWLAVCRYHHEELEGDHITGIACKAWSMANYEQAMEAV